MQIKPFLTYSKMYLFISVKSSVALALYKKPCCFDSAFLNSKIRQKYLLAVYIKLVNNKKPRERFVILLFSI